MNAHAQEHEPTQEARATNSAPAGLLRRKCACGGAAGISEECGSCGRKKLTLQRRAEGPAATAAPPVVNEVLASPGRPLEASTRSFMEARFGHDFGRVRVHADARAAESARAVGALAYTVGPQVVFAAGQYRPETGEGRRLLAHELAHVVQQGDGARFQGKVEVGPADGPEERQADEAAEALDTPAAHSFEPLKGSTPVLRRKTGGVGSWITGLLSSAVLGTTGLFPESWLQEYLEKLDRTNDIEGDPDSDDKAQEIVLRWRKGNSPFVLTAQRKALLIHELLDGATLGGDEEAILELLERSYNFELSYIFGPGGVTAGRLVEDIPADEGDRLYIFFATRCEGGNKAALAGNFKPKGAPPVTLGIELPPPGAGSFIEHAYEGGKTGWTVPCLLGILCAQDRDVVDKLPDLNVKRMEKIEDTQWTFDGTSWKGETITPTGVNEPSQKLVGIVNRVNCASAAKTVVHEVRHQFQSAEVRSTDYTMEVDAYTEAEKWAIARGLPPTDVNLRKTVSGAETPDPEGIDAKVRAQYGGPADKAGAAIVGHEGAMAVLKLPGGGRDKRPAEAGDTYVEKKPKFFKEETIDPKEWVCPQEPGKQKK